MRRRYNLTHFLLACVIVLGLTLLMVCVDAQARIAFVSHRDGNSEIYMMDINGGNQRNLTNHTDQDFMPSWSPDGKRIAFSSNRDGHVIDGITTLEIYVMDANGDNPQNLTNNPSNDYSPSWSPDGKRVAFVSDRDKRFIAEIYVMGADGGNPQRLTNNPHDDYSPSWSPDSKRIIFVSHRDGHFIGEVGGITLEIYAMDADGENLQKLTENRKNDRDPSWSPNGKRIAFASDRKGDAVNPEIYAMDADGGNLQRLTENRHEDASPSWSPDGKRIAFYSLRGMKADIYVMDADGQNEQRLTNTHVDASPAWFNSPFSVSPASKKFTMWGRLKQVDR